MKNNVAYMTELNKIEIRQEEIPTPLAKEVLVKIEYAGICGSDVHYFHEGKCAGFVVDGEFILGHECAGTVTAIGSEVITLKVGDKVALEPGITCGQCEFCKSGKYNLCPDVEFLATPPYHGCYKNYLTFPENMCFKLPENVTTMQGAFVEPLAVGLHAADQAGVKLGDNVVILGSGCIGLCTLLACKANGATDITVVDVFDNRLEVAKKLGATRVVNAKETDILISDLVNSFTRVIETAGSHQTLKQTAHLVKTGGTIVIVGMAADSNVTFDFGQIMSKEAEIKTVFRYRNIYKKAISAIANGIIDVGPIVSHEFEFKNIQKAFEECINNKQEVVKAVIKIG